MVRLQADIPNKVHLRVFRLLIRGLRLLEVYTLKEHAVANVRMD